MHRALFEGTPPQGDEKFAVRRLFEGRTSILWKLECHVTTVAPGGSLAPHVDAHDVVIVILEGEIETRGQRVGPRSVIFYPADESHGVRNPGDVVARYVVLEFHARRLSRLWRSSDDGPSLLARLADPQRWKRKLGQLARRQRP
jgi:mannose-6-phosphate isomerase-like protein (cupin superfamily)